MISIFFVHLTADHDPGTEWPLLVEKEAQEIIRAGAITSLGLPQAWVFRRPCDVPCMLLLRKLMHSRLQVTLLGLWMVPAVISFHMRYWRFLSMWVVFSGMTLYMLSLCSVGRMERSTPRRVRSQVPIKSKCTSSAGLTCC